MSDVASIAALRALADRCEAASGPDRELDALIRCALFAPNDAFVRQSPINSAWCIYEIGFGGKERLWEARALSSLQRLGEFTASLDAAMMLIETVGEAWGRPHNLVIASAYGSAYVVPCDGDSYGINDPLKGEGRAQGDIEADRMARAISAAALRAHAASQEQSTKIGEAK